MLMDKNTIRNRFARAAATYDHQAVIQQQVADRLLSLVAANCTKKPGRVLEVGCCTGMLTMKLIRLFPEITSFYVNDLVPEFRSIVMAKLPGSCSPVFLEGDIESIPLPADLDLVISSSTFHWLDDLPGLLERLSDRMTPKATLGFTLYSSANFHELRDICGIGLDYCSPADLRKLVGEKFSLLAFEEEQVSFYFDTPLQLLHHLRQTGVNALADSAWTRSRLREFSESYTGRYGGPRGIPLTYHPLYCVARKP